MDRLKACRDGVDKLDEDVTAELNKFSLDVKHFADYQASVNLGMQYLNRMNLCFFSERFFAPSPFLQWFQKMGFGIFLWSNIACHHIGRIEYKKFSPQCGVRCFYPWLLTTEEKVFNRLTYYSPFDKKCLFF